METQDKISSDVEENEFEKVQEEKVQEDKERTSNDWYDCVKSAILGGFVALAEVAFGVLMLLGIFYLLTVGYNRWFSTDGLIEVGERGYYYDPANDCFVKPMPNRRVLEGCLSLKYEDGDTIGIVLVRNGKYRYVNLNNLTFINEQSYEYADLFRNDVAIALANDTIYHISTEGKILSSEPSTWIYGSVEEITYMQKEIDSDGVVIIEEIPTGVFMYENKNGNYGLMSSDYVRLTPALYSKISAKSKDVFFCEYFESKMGCLIDKNGNYIK